MVLLAEDDRASHGPAEPLVGEEHVCDACHHLFDSGTGQIVAGWERVYWVKAGPFLCERCKDSIITTLGKGVILG